MLTTSGKGSSTATTQVPLDRHASPVCANEDDLKFLACLLDLPVGFHQHPGEASAGWALKEKSRTCCAIRARPKWDWDAKEVELSLLLFMAGIQHTRAPAT